MLWIVDVVVVVTIEPRPSTWNQITCLRFSSLLLLLSNMSFSLHFSFPLLLNSVSVSSSLQTHLRSSRLKLKEFLIPRLLKILKKLKNSKLSAALCSTLSQLGWCVCVCVRERERERQKKDHSPMRCGVA